MINWFLHLFARKGLVGKRVHAWSYGSFGRAHVEGEVVEETEHQLVIDRSAPERQEYRAFVTVWKHDARLRGSDLPLDTTYMGEGT